MSETMNWLRTKSLLFIFKYLTTFLFFDGIYTAISKCALLDTPHFSTHPRNATVRLGEETDISCTVSKFNPTTDSLVWRVRPNEDDTIILPSFDGRNCSKTSTLSLFNIGRKQRTLQCILHRLNEKFVLETYLSKIATITVLYFPNSDEIACGPKTLETLSEEEAILSWCKVPVGSPPVDISWRIGDEYLSSLSSILVKNEGHFLFNQTFRVCKDFHLKTIHCVVSSSDFFPGQKLSCSVGPFIILHKPVVIIQPSEARLLLNDYENVVEVECYAEGFPEIDGIYWSCHPLHLLAGCNNARGRSVVLSVISGTYKKGENDLAVVTCLATNSVGTSIATAKIIIEEDSNISDLSATANDISDIVFQTANDSSPMCKETTLDLIYLPNDNQNGISFLCIVHSMESDTPSPITWYINDKPVPKNKHFLVREVGSHGSSSLTIKLISKSSSRDNISCAISRKNSGFCKKHLYTYPLGNVLHANLAYNHTVVNNSSLFSREGRRSNGVMASTTQANFGQKTCSTHYFQEASNMDYEYKEDYIGKSQTVLVTVLGVITGILGISILFALCIVLTHRYTRRYKSNDTASVHAAITIHDRGHCSTSGLHNNSLNDPWNLDQGLDERDDSFYERATETQFTTSPTMFAYYDQEPSEVSASADSSSSYESVIRSQSRDDHSVTSMSSLENESDEKLPSDDENDSEALPASDVYHNQTLIQMHANHGIASLNTLKVRKSRDRLDYKINVTPPPLPCPSQKD